MLNQTEVTKVSGTIRKIILVDEGNSTAVSCKFSNAGVTADSDGKKIIKAGTPLAGNLEARETAFTLAATAGEPATSNAIGIAVHDVDVTGGTRNGAVLIFGTVDKSKLESDVQALITAEAKKAMKMIQFVV